MVDRERPDFANDVNLRGSGAQPQLRARFLKTPKLQNLDPPARSNILSQICCLDWHEMAWSLSIEVESAKLPEHRHIQLI
jgi:hypothetical protein